jgi:hypothetical protein
MAYKPYCDYAIEFGKGTSMNASGLMRKSSNFCIGTLSRRQSNGFVYGAGLMQIEAAGHPQLAACVHNMRKVELTILKANGKRKGNKGQE